MKREDRETVLAIVEATGMFTPAELSCAREQVDIFLEQPEQQDYFLAVVEKTDGKVAGYLSFGPTPLTEGTFDLYWMAVAPGEQGRGHGSEMVEWLEERVRAAGGRLILVETSSQPRYESTRRFYLGLDYREISRVPDFYRVGDDRITYGKYLSQRS
jgi:ribosomal protein S18 acetylase RimI-like enzyme